MKKLVALALVLVLSLSLIASASASIYDGQRVRIVIGSTSVSGDSYMVADTVNRYLQKYLNCESKVDAVGANEAFAAVQAAKPDGLEFMIFHDMTYLGVLFGSYSEEYALENMVVGPRVGQNPGSCFAAKKDAPYADMKEMTDWLAADSSRTVRISVTDTGMGISRENLEYIWDRYFKENKSHKRAVVGTGLGLSIVKSILQMHHARFGVDTSEDEINHGSTFWFELVCAEAPTETE